MRNYFKIGLLEKCVIYSFCIDNEHDEGKIKVETFFLFLFNQSNFKILIANSKVDLLVKKQLIFPSLLESHPDLKCNSRGIVCNFFCGGKQILENLYLITTHNRCRFFFARSRWDIFFFFAKWF